MDYSKGRLDLRPGEFRYFALVAGLFVSSSLIANTLAEKPWQLHTLILPAGSIVFPISYIFGDVLTEVYGYARTRQVIWAGLLSNILMALAYWIAIRLPPSPFWPHQESFAQIFGQIPRIVLASFVGYVLGEFVNSYVLAKMKLFTRGRYLWARTIGSTVVGQALDTSAFVSIAFITKWPTTSILRAGLSLYTFKVLYEVSATPFTYAAVWFLKKAENVDYFDATTKFSPFRWATDSHE